MKRRFLLSWSALWCTAARSKAPGETVSGLFRDPAPAQAIGRAYLASQPAPPPLAAWPELTGSGSIRTQIQSCIRRDFAEHRMVSVDGWLLAMTEARLCALAALDHPAHLPVLRRE